MRLDSLSEKVCRHTLSQVVDASIGIPLSEYLCRNSFVGIPLSQGFVACLRNSLASQQTLMSEYLCRNTFVYISYDSYDFLNMSCGLF